MIMRDKNTQSRRHQRIVRVVVLLVALGTTAIVSARAPIAATCSARNCDGTTMASACRKTPS